MLSVVICTLNRADSLRSCLAALAPQVACLSGVEIVVVDNNSSDNTREVTLEFANSFPFIRYYLALCPGLSNARNAGVCCAEGDIIAFLDDDALPSPGWANAVTAAFEDPEVAAVGGRTVLAWPDARPEWFPEEFECYLAPYDRGDEKMWVTDNHLPVGANMAFRRELFDELGGFDIRLGYSGKAKLGWEDIEMFTRVRNNGGSILYEPSAVVAHIVGPEKATRAYVRNRLFAEGYSCVFFHYLSSHPTRNAIYADWRAAFREVVESFVFHAKWFVRHRCLEFKYVMDTRRRIGKLSALTRWAARALLCSSSTWNRMEGECAVCRPAVRRSVGAQ